MGGSVNYDTGLASDSPQRYMISYVRKLFRSTNEHARYWRERKIDWSQAYLSTWNHPHRFMIRSVLKTFDWLSLLEVGCGAGANLMNLIQGGSMKQLGGIDVSADAIKLCEETFKGAFFKVGSVEDMLMSDSSCDVVLSDMTLIYIGPRKIDKVVEEMKRVARLKLVLCEFHIPSLWERLWVKMTTGYNAYDYVTLLEKHGLHDVIRYKIPPEAWPGGGLQEKYGYIIVAKVPRRK